jgi:hypothetical protein
MRNSLAALIVVAGLVIGVLIVAAGLVLGGSSGTQAAHTTSELTPGMSGMVIDWCETVEDFDAIYELAFKVKDKEAYIANMNGNSDLKCYSTGLMGVAPVRVTLSEKIDERLSFFGRLAVWKAKMPVSEGYLDVIIYIHVHDKSD